MADPYLTNGKPDDAAATSFYDSIGASYETAFAHDEGLLSFIDRLLKLAAPNSKVLDLGCGTGHPVASSIAKAGHHVTGVDISEKMVQLCQKTVTNGTFEVGDMRSWTPPEGMKYDVVLNILSLFVLSREEIETLANKWASWIKPGGLLAVCSIPADDLDLSSSGGTYDADGLCARDIPLLFMGSWPKVTLFTRQGWKRLLEARGFEIIDEATEIFIPPEEAKTGKESHYFIIAKKTA